MTNKIPKLAFKILLGMLILSFSITACNNDGEKKDAPADTAAKMNKMAEPPVDTPLIKKPTDSGN